MLRGRYLFAVACISLLLHVIGYSQYCIPTSVIGPGEGHFIDGIRLENINNLNTGDSLNPVYNDYTSISTALFKNTNYDLEITSGYAYTDMHYVAWADFNNDGNFDNVNEKLGEVISTASYQTNSINFTVPANAVNGSVRLRITGVYNVIGPDPCAPITYGEIEDYSIILLKPTTFKDIDAPLRATSRGAVSWIDLNNDKNLEACVTGKYDSLPNLIADLYLNEGSDVFSYNQTFMPISNGDHAWFDYDHDGDVDYVYSGFNIFKTAGLFRFEGFDVNDTSQFTLLYNNLFHFSLFSSVAWGDYDNDGDYDVLISGIDTLNEVVLEMYQNIGGDFEPAPMELPAVFGGDIQFVDFDLDCDLDLFITGTDNNTNTLTRLMVNNEGIFTEFDYPFPNLEYGNIDWNDFNTDGFPDLIINGFDGNNPRLEVFLNDSGNNFYNGIQGLPEGNTGDVSFGDFNNDGLNDIIITGPRTDSLDGYPIFLNTGNHSLVPLPFFMEQGSNSFVALGDYDNDQDLDFLVNGNLSTSDPGKWKSRIFNNESSITNEPPEVPTGLTAELYGTQVLLRWNHSTDDHTPKNLLTYNIYMGTSPKDIDVVAPNADVNSGNRYISIPGYIQDTCWIIRDLEIDTFYWSVQAIDNSLNASAFAIEDTIIIQERISQNCELTLSETIINTIDYDKDGNMDLLTRIGDTLYIRKNEDGFNSFDWSNSIKLECQLDPSDVQVSFVDFDNDGDMDFLPTQELDSLNYMYRRVAGNIKKVNLLSFHNTNSGYGLWCDFNNDGDKEYLTSGKAVKYNGEFNKPVTLMYELNNTGTYSLIEHNIPAYTNCGATTGDFDNDLDMDLVIFGLDTLGQAQICLFRNDGNFKFQRIPVEHISLYRFNELNNIYAGDFNLDGLLDFYVNGRDDFQNKFAKVMLNNGDDSFTDAELEIRCWEKTGNYWIDYDNDGDLDIISYSS
ncbi:MAG: VCBS repeat-containing protein, partial [Bacteroidales bacterium]|nr:VCBS repeat-containing protein [Bacteroidales bacterium]